jgi:hypothetical protein
MGPSKLKSIRPGDCRSLREALLAHETDLIFKGEEMETSAKSGKQSVAK